MVRKKLFSLLISIGLVFVMITQAVGVQNITEAVKNISGGGTVTADMFDENTAVPFGSKSNIRNMTAAADSHTGLDYIIRQDEPAIVPSGTGDNSLTETSATPIGNGYMGALIFGGVENETILINEKTLWSGGPESVYNYNGGLKNTSAANKMQLNLARQRLQDSMSYFTDTGKAYVDSFGKLYTQDYPGLPWDAESALKNYTTGDTTAFGSYEELGLIQLSQGELESTDYKATNILSNAGEVNVGNEGLEKLFDGRIDNKWCHGKNPSASDPIWINWEYSSAVTFNAYKITTGNDMERRDPKTWKFLGSNTGLNGSYTVIDEQTDYDLPLERRATAVFNINKSARYKYYRLEIYDVRNNGNGCQISEFSPYKEQAQGGDDYTDYSRILDLKTGVAAITYKQNGIAFKKEYFMSYPDNAFVMKISSDTPGAVSQNIGVEYRRKKGAVSVSGDTITVTGQPDDQRENGLHYIQKIKVIPQGGTLSSANSSIQAEGADSIVLIMTAGTNYQPCTDGSYNYFADKETAFQRVEARLNSAADKGYDDLLAAHTGDYRELYDRVSLNIGADSTPAKTTAALIKDYNNGNTVSEDRYLETLYYNFSRYLMIACSREGTLPANSQGIWSWGMKSSSYTGYNADMRTQMMYWLAEPSNLSECSTPLISYINSLVESGKKTAAHYHAKQNGEDVRGWTAYQSMNIWGYTAPGKFDKGYYSPTSGASLVQSIWNRYEYGKDNQFLSGQYDTILDAALFWVDNLWEDEKDGKLVANPSYSPNQGEYSLGSAYDQAVIWEIFETAQQAAKALDKENDAAVKEIKEAQSRLAVPTAGLGGQFMEWKDEVTKDVTGGNNNYVNLLYSLYPGTQTVNGRSAQDNLLASAMRQSLTSRGDGGEGWNKAWKLNLWAHLHDGDKAFKLLSKMLSSDTMDNLINKNQPFQIDGNLGAAAGMIEMIMQDQGDYIELMPAVPAVWKDGSVSGLKARGNFEIGMEWKDRILQASSIKSISGEECTINYPGLSNAALKDDSGKTVSFTIINADLISFKTQAGKTYTLTDIPQTGDFSDSRYFMRAMVNNLYTSSIVEEVNAPEEIGRNGAYIQGFEDGSLARIIGMKKNDIIVKINGYSVENTASLMKLYNAISDGTEIILKVWRENRYIKFVFTKSDDNNAFIIDGHLIEAEDCNDKGPGETPRINDCQDIGGGKNLGNIGSGDWVVYKDLNFYGTPPSITFRAAKDTANAVVSIHLDSKDSPPIATCTILGLMNPLHPQYHPDTPSNVIWHTYFNFDSTEIKQKITGTHDLYLTFNTPVNVNWFYINSDLSLWEETPYGKNDPEKPDGTAGGSVKKGDVNGDENINIFDIMMIRDHIFGKNILIDEAYDAADVNGDDDVNIFDIMMIRDYIFGKIISFD